MIQLPVVSRWKAPALFFAERDIILLTTLINKYSEELGIINNLGSYTLAIVRKIILQFYSYKQVAEVVGDYNSAMALVRHMADSISSFVFVYGSKDTEEQKIRHCLYVLDGVQQSMDELSYPMIKTEYISDEDFALLKKQYNDAMKNRQSVKDYLIEQLNSYSLIQQNPTARTIINHADWRYKDLSVKYSKDNRYTWNELYSFLSLNDECKSFISFLSQNVHGLSISNLFVEATSDNLEPLNSFVYHLTHYSLLKTCVHLFGEETFRKEVLENNPNLVYLLTDEELRYFFEKQQTTK